MTHWRGKFEAFEGLLGNREYRITAAGLKHPQRRLSGRQAQAPRLPVDSDRVRNVLSTILDASAPRIRDVTEPNRMIELWFNIAVSSSSMR
jgi:hypothetical protein